jgi:hypothetical protein
MLHVMRFVAQRYPVVSYVPQKGHSNKQFFGLTERFFVFPQLTEHPGMVGDGAEKGTVHMIG